MRALLVMVCLCACVPQTATVAVQQAATVLGGDGQVGATCTSEATCPPRGGGTGGVVLPLVVIGAAALVIAGVSYVNYVVQQSARAAPPARHPATP